MKSFIRTIGSNWGKKIVVWWFDVMNRAWASIASCSLCSTKCFRNISQFWLFVWNAELSGYWSYLSLGPRCVPSVFAGVWACISINVTFIGITRDSDDFPLNVTVFHIKKIIEIIIYLKTIICYHNCNKSIISCTLKIFQH